jgi:XRE family transcriptional regulator, fatty acid utilization regulator
VLQHEVPRTYLEFLGQRVATNYLAAALLIPESSAVAFLRQSMKGKEIAVEDLRDNFAVSYEAAAHRFTNLATHHLGIRTHFQKVHKSGIIFKAYENDDVAFPADPTGAIEGQPICRTSSTPSTSTRTPRRAPTGARPAPSAAPTASSR